MDGTPPPVVPDCVEPLRQHLLQNAANARQRWQGHGLPALGLGILLAAADVTSLDREPPAMGQRDPVPIPAQVVQHPLRALQGRFAVDDPPLGPDPLRGGKVRPFLTHQVQEEPAKELRERMDRHKVLSATCCSLRKKRKYWRNASSRSWSGGRRSWCASWRTASRSHCWVVGARPRSCRSSSIRRRRVVMGILLCVWGMILLQGSTRTGG
jgi:hypothetical protein